MAEVNSLKAEHCFKIFFQCIDDYHQVDDVTKDIGNPYPEKTLNWYLYQKNKIDTYQWHYEDLIRIPDAPDSEIVRLKRLIDQSNQDRTDLVEVLDDWIIEQFASVKVSSQAKLNTESPAWVIDRMSILALKIFHMKEQVDRNLDEEHTNKCRAKLEILLEQEKDLGQSFDEYMEEISSGTRRVKVYRQMKMYNDKTLNPALYASKG